MAIFTRSRKCSFNVANVRLNWSDIAGFKVSAAMFLTNAFDKAYYSGGLQTGSSLGLDTAIPGEPRMFGGAIKVAF